MLVGRYSLVTQMITLFFKDISCRSLTVRFFFKIICTRKAISQIISFYIIKIQELLDTIERNQAVVISGATGCGKTTQIPQFILEDQISQGKGSVTRIFVTQPRRISAISVAERVAAERGEEIGQTIGYQVRLEHRFPNRSTGTIMYCTTGILLQMLHSDPLLKVSFF